MPATASALPIHIAAVGASAGGLEAMLPLFARVQPNGRLSYVVAQHMAKDGHDELVARLMNRESALPVQLATQSQTLVADTIYVIPSGSDGVIRNGRLVLQEPQHLSTPSVNALFSSLAETAGNQAIGIVLSGTGMDGSNGCRAIKAAGGLTIAQQPSEAKFDGMPSAAIAAGVIDEILSLEAIAARLASRYPPSHPASAPSRPTQAGTSSWASPTIPGQAPARPSEYSQLLQLIEKATGIDFSSYKEDTLLRRLDKRMGQLNLPGFSDYLALVHRQPEELKTIQHLFLVSVSSFFRDRESFAVLQQALSKTVADKPAAEAVRVWVPGCASGEEALTLAILLSELSNDHPIEIVGTDLNPEALAIARSGRYQPSAFREMDASVCALHFHPCGQHFEANAPLLATIRYEQRDVLAPPTLSNLDLISCRNLLIYMKTHLQDQLIGIFHQALAPQGLLFIGQSESLSFVGNALFSPIDHYHRLFRRRP